MLIAWTLSNQQATPLISTMSSYVSLSSVTLAGRVPACFEDYASSHLDFRSVVQGRLSTMYQSSYLSHSQFSQLS